MNIGILSKRTDSLAGKMKAHLESVGFNVKIYTADNLCINESLFENEFYILKSKGLFYRCAGHYLEANNIPVVPNTDITYKHRNRIEAHLLIKQAGLLFPDYYFGSFDALKDKLTDDVFPLILKPLMGSESKGVRIINSFENLQSENKRLFYLEKYIQGIHYLVYFIDDEICALEKPPLSNEHVDMKEIPLSDDIVEAITKWKNCYNLLFGHLDIVREETTNKLYVVDPGPFPAFSNWNCGSDPVPKICNLLLKRFEELKK